MDINEAALELKRLEIIALQLAHLRSEAANTQGEIAYSTDCNNKAQELIRLLPVPRKNPEGPEYEICPKPNDA